MQLLLEHIFGVLLHLLHHIAACLLLDLLAVFGYHNYPIGSQPLARTKRVSLV